MRNVSLSEPTKTVQKQGFAAQQMRMSGSLHTPRNEHEKQQMDCDWIDDAVAWRLRHGLGLEHPLVEQYGRT